MASSPAATRMARNPPVNTALLVGGIALAAAGVYWLYGETLDGVGLRRHGVGDQPDPSKTLFFYGPVMAGISAALATSWNSSFHVGPGRALRGTLLATVPVAAALLAVAEAALVRSDGNLAQVLAVAAGSTKWVFLGLSVALIAAMGVARLTTASRRSLPDGSSGTRTLVTEDSATQAPSAAAARPTLGIACSGGGIRSAAFSLGGLAALEQVGELGDGFNQPSGLVGNADYLSSVSGGGYAASAWRIAAGTSPTPPPIAADGLIGDPTLRTNDANRLIDHVRRHRRYLANGRGGLPGSLLKVGLRGFWHFGLLLLVVYVVSWPVGRLIQGWNEPAINREVWGVALKYWPTLLTAIPALSFFAIRLGLHRGNMRSAVDKIALGFAGVFVGVAVGTIALPYLIDVTGNSITTMSLPVVAAGTSTVITAVWQVGKRLVKPYVKVLGGVFLAIALFGLGLVVMAFASPHSEDQLAGGGEADSPVVWLVLTIVLICAFAYLNPDSWSLNRFYRRRLAETFAVGVEDGNVVTVDDSVQIDAFAGAWGPQPMICCAAARDNNSDTGIPAQSIVFEPRGVTVHWPIGQIASATLSPQAMRARLPSSTQGQRAFSMMGAAAISGAAFAPAMGRKSKGTTNALYAAFNARLGVWLPNPNGRDAAGKERKTTPRLVNMFKEIKGLYEPDDPNVYVTDGGHFENLGLIELLRKECSVIICLDASSGGPGEFRALKRAADLAWVELGVKLELAPMLGPMAVQPDTGLPTLSSGCMDFQYPSGADGRIVYVRSVVINSTSLGIRRYSATDSKFPNYSSSDQFLTEDQFAYLSQLGFEATNAALAAHKTAILARLTPPG